MARKVSADEQAFNQDAGSRIRYLRTMAKLTQKQVGDLVGVSPQQLQKYEVGITGMTLYMFGKIGDILMMRIEQGAQAAPAPVAAPTAKGKKSVKGSSAKNNKK